MSRNGGEAATAAAEVGAPAASGGLPGFAVGAHPAAVVLGLGGEVLTEAECRLLKTADPVGVYLFARNCSTPPQTRALIEAVRTALGRDAPVFIDQEGGRVRRLTPPQWLAAPPAAAFGALAQRDPQAARDAAFAAGRMIGLELSPLGVTVNAAPVLDLHRPETTRAIGDRAFAGDPATVATLGRSLAEGLMSAGVLPIGKHAPGHGRAAVDSHLALPRVDATVPELDATDVQAFRAMADLPALMTAHVLYTAIDPEQPATTSETVIRRVVRDAIGFRGLLVSDDLDMRALSGTRAERAGAALAAGCDLVLQCSGVLSDAEAVMPGVSPLSAHGHERWVAAVRQVAAHHRPAEDAGEARGLFESVTTALLGIWTPTP